MKKLLASALLIIPTFAVSSVAGNPSIVDVAASDPQFSTLVSLLKKADLVDTLNGDGPFTVFAPTNQAFSKVPKETLASLEANPEQLKKVLTYHVVSGKVPSATAKTLTEANTVAGEKFNIRKSYGNLKINDATVIKADIMASNGVVHVIDQVLIP